MSWSTENREQESVWRDRYDCEYPNTDFIWPSESEWQRHWNRRTWPDTYDDWKDRMLAPRSQQRHPRQGDKSLKDWKWEQENHWRKKYDYQHGCSCVRYNWQTYGEWQVYWAIRDWPEDYDTWKRRMQTPTRR